MDRKKCLLTMNRESRSYTMSRIRKTNTKPELLIRSHLFKAGFRYRLYNKKLPGNPDIVLPKYKAIVFVNGCFWHAHEGCKYNKMPKTRTEYWIPKITGNAQRDKINLKALKKLGWKIFVIWECELRKESLQKTLSKFVYRLTKRLNEIY